MGNLKQRVHSEILQGHMVIISNWMLKIELKGVDWIYLAQDIDKWQVIVITVTNFPIP